MNEAIVREVFAKVNQGIISFPQVVSTLTSEGFDSYHIDYLRGEGRYYHQSGESFQKKFNHTFPAVAANFSADGVLAAIRRSQAGTATYSDFIRDSAAAGCAYYIVYLKGKKVRYLGRNGDEHVEYFPGQDR